MDRRASIAVDLGAESCRVSLLQWHHGLPRVQLVHRFPNGPVRAADGTLRWPLQAILAGVEDGVRRAAALAPEGVASIAVDGWAVDYVRLSPDGAPLEDPFCYRDPRNARAAEALHLHVSPEWLRELTGIQQQPLNTLYQLYADKLEGRVPAPWLNLPEYLLHRWGAPPVAEQTNASHTQLVELGGAGWSERIFKAAELPPALAARIVPAGTTLGYLAGPLATMPSLAATQLIAPACHDTASAIAGIAQEGHSWAYISCGTWSLVGTLLPTPLNGPEVRSDNFTNLQAVGGLTCFHKGINGLWVLKQCLDHWASSGSPWELPKLLEAAALAPEPAYCLHVDDPLLLGMGDMPARIRQHCLSRGLPPPSTHSDAAPALVALLLHSLAARYVEVLERLETHTGKRVKRIVMVGGGAQNVMLRQLTAQRTGLPVVAGPAESSTVGNLAVQRAVLEGSSPLFPVAFAREVSYWAHQVAGLPS